jgi:hypothetical protein
MGDIPSESAESLEGFFAALRNLDRTEREEFREIIKAQFRPTLRERYLTVNYHRAAFNVEMLLKITDTKQFQAISLLTRAIFELAVETKLIQKHADAAEKIKLYSDVELLRAARKIVQFKKDHPKQRFHHETYQTFIDLHGARIDAAKNAVWTPKPGKTDSEIKHWTRKPLSQRARVLGDPFDRIYEVHYPDLSWMTHSGVVTPLNMTTEWVTSFVGIVYSIAVDSYIQILDVLVDEFKLYTTNEYIREKMRCNRDLGFTKTAAEAEEVMRKHGLWRKFEPPTPLEPLHRKP